MIQVLIDQYTWRFRGHLASQDLMTGWREDPHFCPLACWLATETGNNGFYAATIDDLYAQEQCVPTPLVFQLFIEIIDDGIFAESKEDSRIWPAEALLALSHAERLAMQRLLPERAESNRCSYQSPDGEACNAQAVSPYLQAGRFCEAHCQLFIGAPDSWWPAEPAPKEAPEVRQVVAI